MKMCPVQQWIAITIAVSTATDTTAGPVSDLSIVTFAGTSPGSVLLI